MLYFLSILSQSDVRPGCHNITLDFGTSTLQAIFTCCCVIYLIIACSWLYFKMCAVVQHQPALHMAGDDDNTVPVPNRSPKAKQREVAQPSPQNTPEQASPEQALEVDLSLYDPPSALDEVADITDDTVKLVVESSLEAAIQQVEAERKQRDTKSFPLNATEEQNDEGNSKGKMIARDLTPLSNINHDETTHENPLQPGTKTHHRRRFGFLRMFGRMAERGQPSSAFHLSQLPAHIHNITPSPSTAAETLAPSPFTQLIYKRIKPPSEASSSTETV